MLAEFFEAIHEKADEKKSIKILNIPKAPACHVYYDNGDGEIHTEELPPELPAFTITDLDSLSDLAIRWSADAQDSPCIFFDSTGVVLFRCFHERRSKATLPLTLHPLLERIKRLGGTAYSQKELLRVLNVELRPCCTSDADKLLAAIRGVKFIKNQEGDASITNQKASVGKKLLQEMCTETPIPEIVTFIVPVFSNPQLRTSALLRCSVDVDLEDQSFRISLFAGEYEKALSEGEDYIRSKLESKLEDVSPSIPLYRGKP